MGHKIVGTVGGFLALCSCGDAVDNFAAHANHQEENAMSTPTVTHTDPAVAAALQEVADLHPDDRDVVTIVELAVNAARQQDSDALEARARASYDDAVRLDAFGPEEARQAFLEGYVRGATA